MSKATELAEELMAVHKGHSDEGPTAFSEAATEMIRLEEITAELLEALKPFAVYGRMGSWDIEVEAAMAAIAKATQKEK